MKQEDAKIQFKGIIFKETRLAYNKHNVDYTIDFKLSPKGLIKKSSKQYLLNLQLHIKEVNSYFEIEIQTESVFEFNDEFENNNEFMNYFTINAPAIVYPYIRAYVSSLTALSGLPVLTLPTLNLVGIGEELRNNITVEE